MFAAVAVLVAAADIRSLIAAHSRVAAHNHWVVAHVAAAGSTHSPLRLAVANAGAGVARRLRVFAAALALGHPLTSALRDPGSKHP